MGWLVVIMIYPLLKTFKELNALSSLLWLLAGGIFYTIGGIIYGLKKFPFTTKNFGFHEIFHIFVMLGSFCQYWFIFRYLLYI
jgi:hemolysin III